MFNTGRWHRLLTLPTLAVAVAVLFLNRYVHYALAACPVMVALPFQLRAAWRGDAGSLARALGATRLVSYVGLAWGIVVIFFLPPVGAILLVAFLALLAVAGTDDRETRLAGAVMIEGLLIALAGLPLAWIGSTFFLLIPAGIVLFLGATWWLVEAACRPALPVAAGDFPTAIAL